MKRCLFTYILIMLFLASCGKKEVFEYTIKGKVSDNACSMLIFGLDNRFEKVDSIKAGNNGKFSYTIATDTLIPLAMLMPDGKMITIYAEPGVKAKLSYDSIAQKRWVVEGGPMQSLHDSISLVMDACRNDAARIDSIEKFIKENPLNEVDIELLRRYMIETPQPDNAQIRNFISLLGGILQDNEYLAITKKNIESRNSYSMHRSFPSFTYTTADSCKEVNLSTFNKKHLLVTFWASWDSTSREGLKHLYRIEETVKSENFEILNIALDHDTIEWKKAVKSDSIIGYNVCEEMAWNSDIAKKLNAKALPYSVLVSPYQRIIRLGLDLADCGELIDSLAQRYDKSIEKRNKEENKKKNSKRK